MPTDDLTDLENTLRTLQPRSDVDHEAFLISLGQVSAPRSRFWPTLAILSTLSTLTLGMLLALRQEPPARIQIVYLPAPAPVPSQPTPTPPRTAPAYPEPEPAFLPMNDASLPLVSPLLQMEENLARYGLDGIPAPPGEKDPPSVNFPTISAFGPLPFSAWSEPQLRLR